MTPAPAERPRYDGQDVVGAVSMEQIVGTWDITPLNPLRDGGLQARVVRYRSNGTVTAVVRPSRTLAADSNAIESQSPGVSGAPDTDTDSQLFDEARFLVTGRWSVVDGQVVHRDMQMTTRSDNENARLLAAMINESSATAISIADVHDIDEDSMTLVGRDGVAMHYARRPVADK